jgi:hypothetical protein
MEEKDRKKSFEEILNELNLILQSMPSIIEKEKNILGNETENTKEKKEEISNIEEIKNINKENKFEENKSNIDANLRSDKIESESKPLNSNTKDITENINLSESGNENVNINIGESKVELQPNAIDKNEISKEDLQTENINLSEDQKIREELIYDISILDNNVEDKKDLSNTENEKEKKDEVYIIEPQEDLKILENEKEIESKNEEIELSNETSLNDFNKISLEVNANKVLEEEEKLDEISFEIDKSEDKNEPKIDENIISDFSLDEDLKIETKDIRKEEGIEIEKFPSFEVVKDEAKEEKKETFIIKKNEFEENLKEIIEITPPQNIPSERIKNVGFVYLSEEETFVELLKMIDEICLSSKEKPMFVNRSFVLNYDDTISSDVIIFNAKNEKVIAVVFVGQIPPDKKYEFENSLSQEGIYFINFNKANLTKSSVIDFIMELIIR